MPATNELLQEGRYRICQPTDGSGNVFEAYDTVRNTNVIVREIPVRLNKVATVSQRESLQLAFANQAKALTEIEHDALLQVRDFFSEIDRQYLVMDPLEGDDLRKLIGANKQPFSVSQVTAWADELLDALTYLHTRKPPIVHLNIRPENLKLSPSGRIKLVGFSLEGGMGPDVEAQPDEGDLRYSPMEKIWPGLDAASQKVITNSYDDRSERILKEPADARSDIYSLGATLYFLVTGTEPIDPLERSIEMLEGKLDPLPEPTRANSSIPPEISDVLMKALEIKRENRYDSALIMRQVLQTALERVAERERQVPQPETAAIIQQAAETKTVSPGPIVATKSPDTDAEKRRQEELRQQQQQAEKQRLEAERVEAEATAQRLLKEKADAERLQQEKAESEKREKDRAEAERLQKEKVDAAELQKQQADSEKADAPEDSLLEIPVTAEVVAHGENAVDEDELAAVLEEIEKAEAASSGAPPRWRPDAESTAVDGKDETASSESDIHGSDTDAEVDADIFSIPVKSRSALPLPAVAGAIGLVITLAIGGWVVISGSSEAPRAQPVALPVQTPEPAPAIETPPATDSIVSGSGELETAPSANTSETSSLVTAAPKAAPTAKPKKAEKAAEKKKVTVDDLINDN